MHPTESRLNARTFGKIEEVALHFPELELSKSRDHGETVWEGWLKPIVSQPDYGALLDDLDMDRHVEVCTGPVVGIRHSPTCTVEHGDSLLAAKIGNPFRLFRIRVTDFNDSKMPLCQVIEPEITHRTRNHTRGSDGMCLYPPWRFPWTERSSIVELLKHAMIWLIKWDVFDRGGRWIGSETPHSFDYLLANVSPSDSCTCFSGKEYGQCCRYFHITAEIIAKHRRNEFLRIYPLYLNPFPHALSRFLVC